MCNMYVKDAVRDMQSHVKRILVALCKVCGQPHQKQDAHLYDYNTTVDNDLTCPICLQPLVNPYDSHCGHTFCKKCIKKYLHIIKECPVDRRTTKLSDIRPSNLLLKRLLDKLLVVCPNTDYCEEVLPRCELEAHLQYRCKGAVIKCLRHEQGCDFQGPRQALQSHLWECPYRDAAPEGSEGSNSWVPVADGGITTLDIQRGCYDLGISIVGGIDTPLMCVLIQEVHSDGAAAKDGRLQSGDQLLEVNGIDLTNVTHLEARDALLQPYPICRMSVYREKSENEIVQEREESFKITLPKLHGKQLGIKLVNRKSIPGLYIFEVMDGSTAQTDGRLLKEDRILQINEQDMTYGTQEQASKIIQASTEKVQFRISRLTRVQTPDILRSSPSKESLLNFSVYSKDGLFTYYPFTELQERLVSISKEKDESLGMSIAGGVQSQQKYNTPIYVSNIQEGGCLWRSKQLQKGDVLLSINGNSLIELSHPEAVHLIKKCASDDTVTLRVLACNETSPSSFEHFQPSWKFWLQMPEKCHCVKSVILERSIQGSLGFSIVGGCDSGLGLVPIFVKAVVPGTPAAMEGKLRSGDMLLGVNGQTLDDITHTEAVSYLKGAKGQKVTLKVVSWPGTYV